MADRGRATDWRSRDRGWCPERGPRGARQGGGLPAARGQRREGPVSNAPEIRNVFIRRPIFSGVISIVIVLLRSEEHTSELQSRLHLVCRLLLEKKKSKHNTHYHRPSMHA